jgi:hypothetical protein
MRSHTNHVDFVSYSSTHPESRVEPLTDEELDKVREIVANGGYLTASAWGRRLLATVDALQDEVDRLDDIACRLQEIASEQ